MLLPDWTDRSRVLVPEKTVVLPTGADNVEVVVLIHIDRELAAVDDKFSVDPGFAELLALESRRFIPVGSTRYVEAPVAVHVHDGDTFRMVAADLVL